MQIGRNAPCPCGSGKKYKKCCLAKDEALAREQRATQVAYQGAPSSGAARRQAEDVSDVTTLNSRQLIDRGYSSLKSGNLIEACRLWWWAWQRLKPLIADRRVTDVSNLDTLLPGKNLVYNWCQDMEEELGNAMDSTFVFAIRRIAFAGEFVRLLPDSDLLILQNMRRAIAESYDFLGERDKCETEFRRLVEDYPNWVWGYVGWGDTYRMSRAPGREKDLARARAIYEMGLRAGTDEPQVLQERLQDLAAESRRPGQPSPANTEALNCNELKVWLKAYRDSSPLDQYRLFLALARQPLPESFAAGLDQGELAVDVFSMLERHNLQEQAVELLEALQANWSEYYSKEFYYFDPFLVSRCLYLDRTQALPAILQRFYANPVDSIDSLTPVFGSLVAYECRDLANETAEKVFPIVASSDKLMPGAEIDFAMAVFADRLERVYAQQQAGERADWEGFTAAVAPFDFEVTSELAEDIDTMWAGAWTAQKLRDVLEEDYPRGLALLGFGFNKYMRERKEMGFPCSMLIWRQFEGLLRKQRAEDKKKPRRPAFEITMDLLDNMVFNQLGFGFFGLSNKKVDAVALVWGLPYVYDYLHSLTLIDSASYQKHLDIVIQIKELLFEVMTADLWKYAFVLRWRPADSTDEQFRRYEEEIFAQSFRRRVPLPDTGDKSAR